jgi:ABC-2 type transport system ATP-binding protein
MLTTLIPPTSGSAQVAGYDVVTEQRSVRQRIGYIGQGNGAAHSQRGRDELVSQGRSYGLSRGDARRRAAELVESLDLAAVVDRNVSTLSGGQRRRLDIAMGLIHAPELLFLDEPSTGLDPQNRANLQEHVLALRERYGTTIVITTHYLEEADAIAERVVVVDHGSIIADDTPARLKALLVRDKITIGLASVDDVGRAATRVHRHDASATTEIRDTVLEVRTSGGPAMTPRLLADLGSAGVEVTSVEVTRPTLDDVFLTLTGRSLREDGQASAAADETTARIHSTDQNQEIAA